MNHGAKAYNHGTPPTGHRIAPEHLEEFRRIYKEAYGEEITTLETTEMAHRLVALYRLLLRPLPGEPSTHPPSQQLPAQRSPEAS